MKTKSQKRRRPDSEIAAQVARTNRNKLNQTRRRRLRREYWKELGVRKNGTPVKRARVKADL